MKLRSWARRLWWRVLLGVSKREVVCGVRVHTLLPDAPREALLEKLRSGLELVALYAPQSLSRLQRLNGILVFGDEGPIGEWHREAQIVKLSERYVAGASTHAAHVAATVVHEAAHARIEESGVRYTEDRRRRIEAICIRAEARFAGRIPGGAELSDYYRAKANRVLADSEERWSNASFRRRDIRALVALDTPRLILRMLGVSAEEITLERQRQQAEALDV